MDVGVVKSFRQDIEDVIMRSLLLGDWTYGPRRAGGGSKKDAHIT